MISQNRAEVIQANPAKPQLGPAKAHPASPLVFPYTFLCRQRAHSEEHSGHTGELRLALEQPRYPSNPREGERTTKSVLNIA